MKEWKRQKEKWALNPNGFFEHLSLPKIHPFICLYNTNPSRKKSIHFLILERNN
jgi:hypothetical protein